MIKSSVEKLAGDIGFDIGNSDNITQAKLLNGFGRALATGLEPHNLDIQLHYISDELNGNTCKILKKLVEFIELKEG